ncbi:MAG: hypothetical protein JWP58_3257 [Hymenobacter sp.]|nr:hypothetical protein [Hymenobacter sp.]
MPATSTIPPVLKALLKHFKTNLAEVSRNTGIARKRLMHLVLTGEFTKTELRLFADCLQPEFARSFIGISQAGNFNIAGNGNRQRVTIINKITHITNNTLVVFQAPPTTEEPEPKALVNSPQRWEVQPMQPDGQVRQLGQPMQPGGQVHQIGAAVVAQELGRAA